MMNAQDVAKIDEKLRHGAIEKKFTDRGELYTIKKGETMQQTDIDKLKGDSTCGVYNRMFSDNIRLHVKTESEISEGLDQWLEFVEGVDDSLACSSTRAAVANQKRVLHACQDPPAVDMHRALLGDDGHPRLDQNGLVVWRSMRGTNRVETFWSAAAANFTPPVSAAPHLIFVDGA